MTREAKKSLLCVGGPLGGKRFEAERGAGFTVPRQTNLPYPGVDYDEHDVAVAYVNHHYRAEVIHTPQGDIEFWAPVEQTPLESLTILLGAYACAAERF